MSLVTGYENGKGISPLSSEKVYSIFIGSGGLYASPKDMLTFLSFNLRKERTSLNAILPIMQTPYHSFKNFNLGLGWKISTFEQGKAPYYFLDGNLFGFGMYMGMIPENDLGVVILYNQGELNPTLLAYDLLQKMLSIQKNKRG
jgi:CubicO group peptidase (beta-lactamase class C family)